MSFHGTYALQTTMKKTTLRKGHLEPRFAAKRGSCSRWASVLAKSQESHSKTLSKTEPPCELLVGMSHWANGRHWALTNKVTPRLRSARGVNSKWNAGCWLPVVEASGSIDNKLISESKVETCEAQGFVLTRLPCCTSPFAGAGRVPICFGHSQRFAKSPKLKADSGQVGVGVDLLFVLRIPALPGPLKKNQNKKRGRFFLGGGLGCLDHETPATVAKQNM